MPNLPFFPFYVNDWLGSTTIACLKPEQEGGFIRLLAHSWNKPGCVITDNMEDLTLLSRLDSQALATLLTKAFVKVQGGYYNAKLRSVREEYENHSKEMSEAGKKGAEKKKLLKLQEKERIARLEQGLSKAKAEHKPSSSLSPSYTEKEDSPLKPPRKTGGHVVDKKLYIPHFTEFWDTVYPHREGVPTGKRETWEEFLCLTTEEIPKFMRAAKSFRMLKERDPFGIPDPIRFLVKGRGNKKIRPWLEYVDVKIPEGGVNAGQKIIGRGGPKSFTAIREAEQIEQLKRLFPEQYGGGAGDGVPPGDQRPAVDQGRGAVLEGEAVEIPELETTEDP